MAWQNFEPYNVNSHLSSPTMELQPFRPGFRYNQVPIEYQKVNPTASSGEREYLVSEISTGPAQGYKDRLLNRIDRWKDACFGFPGRGPTIARNKFRGWRKGVMAAAALTGSILIINIIATLALMVKYGARDGVGTIYVGDCDVVKRWSVAIHLLINILGTGLLAASNFTMQCLSSPTRSESDAAHAKRKSLDIGNASFKNLFYVSRWKGLAWWGLALSSSPLHLLWNSTVFSTLGANDFAYAIVTENFFHGAPYDAFESAQCLDELGDPYADEYLQLPTIDLFYDVYAAGKYSTQMTPSECIDAYTSSFISERRNMIAVTKAIAGVRMSPACGFGPPSSRNWAYDRYFDEQPLWSGSSILAWNGVVEISLMPGYLPHGWLCEGWNGPSPSSQSCDRDSLQLLRESNGSWYLRPDDESIPYDLRWDRQSYLIEYCYSEVTLPGNCQLQFISYIFYVVIVCNLIKLICMAFAMRRLWNLNEPILATVGDAVVSFIERPDQTTEGWCLMDLAQVSAWQKADRSQQERYVRPPRRMLFSATSKTRWLTTISLCALYLAIGIYLFDYSLEHYASGFSQSQILNLGFGAIRAEALLGINDVLRTEDGSSHGLISCILVANVFQVALSITYFLYNALYTAQCGALEWSTYSSPQRKPLRVTWPHGQQKSTYYLSLPYRYGLPLTGFLILLHFLISQSIFVARVQWYDSAGDIDVSNHISDLGYSPIAILVTLCVGGFLIVIQILHSFRPLDNHMPIHGNSSAVISAMCHPSSHISPEHEEGTEENVGGTAEGNGTLGLVTWGAVVQPKDGDEVGHCSFTRRIVERPITGRRYH